MMLKNAKTQDLRGAKRAAEKKTEWRIRVHDSHFEDLI